jgi:hypothetical protein
MLYEYVTDLICALEVGVGKISGTAADRESRYSIGPLVSPTRMT